MYTPTRIVEITGPDARQRIEENRWWLALTDPDAGLYAVGVAAINGRMSPLPQTPLETSNNCTGSENPFSVVCPRSMYVKPFPSVSSRTAAGT